MSIEKHSSTELIIILTKVTIIVKSVDYLGKFLAIN